MWNAPLLLRALLELTAAVPFLGQTTQISSVLSPERGCGPKGSVSVYLFLYAGDPEENKFLRREEIIAITERRPRSVILG